MADWRDPKSYPGASDLPDKVWAWEFLRRNPRYRDDWNLALEEFLVKMERPHPVEANAAKTDPGHRSFRIPSRECLRKWGLMAYVNPDQPRPNHLNFELGWGHAVFGRGPEFEDNPDGVTIHLPNATAAWIFDLRLPISSQIKFATKRLQQWQDFGARRGDFEAERLPRRHREQWPLYIRLLDAVEAGSKPSDIAEVLSQELPDATDEKSVRQSLLQARRMITTGYRAILFP